MRGYGALAATTGVAPRGLTFTRGTMTTKCDLGFLNPKLREVEQEIRAAAYRLRQETKVGSVAYMRLSDAMKGKCSLATLALMCELDARSGCGVLRDAIERTTGTAVSRPSSSKPSQTHD